MAVAYSDNLIYRKYFEGDNMSLSFVIPEMQINGAGTPALQFFKRSFILGYSGGTPGPSWQDIILHGNTALTLVNAKANSLSSLKLFGGTEQRNLPKGYTQLEYLEVETEGVYFPTGINATIDTDMGITASNITSSSAQILVAECESGSDYFRIAKAGASQRIIGSIGSSTVTDNNTNGVNKFTARMNKSGFYVNGSLVGTFSDIPSSLTDIGKVDIFRGKYSNTTYFAYAGSRFYDAFVDDNIFLPFKRNSDNQLGIYNTKTGEFILPSGEGTFTAGPTAVPTPDMPMDIVSNNGAIKYSANIANVNAQTALIGYYISSSGVVTADSNNWIYQDYIPVKPSTTYTLTMSSSVYYVTISEYSTADDSGFIIRKAGVSGDNTTLTITTESTTNYIKFGTNIDRSAVTLDRVLAINWMLAKADTPQPYMPYGQIYTDGTVETVSIHSQNLFNKATRTKNRIINATTGQETLNTNKYCSDYIVVKPNTTYSCNGFDDGSTVNGIAFYDKDKEYVSGIPYSAQIVNQKKITVPNNSAIKYARFGSYNITSADDCMFVEGSTLPTAYEPYFNGGSATAEMLLKVGDYQDVQSVLDGEVTRNVGIKVLDGTENDYAKRSDYAINYTGLTDRAYGGYSYGMCSHFVCSANNTQTAPVGSLFFNTSNIYLHFFTEYGGDVTSFKAWLAEQYANGTPVIVVYPLATPTTESVESQALTIQAGTNVVEITQASMDNLELEVSYKGTV